jgi:hypothetical protein
VRWVQRQWVWAPVSQTPLRARRPRLRLAAMARQRGFLAALRLETSTLKGPAIRADPAARADPGRAGPGRAEPRVGTGAPADPADLRANTVASAAPADPATSTAARADLRAHPADLADRVTRAAPRARLVGRGTGMGSVATSTGPRGATDPHLGDREHHRGPTGAGRSRRPGGDGMVARSTTGATGKRPFGIPGSISGASTSSGFGSRCKPVRMPVHTTPASPLGEAGVVRAREHRHALDFSREAAGDCRKFATRW